MIEELNCPYCQKQSVIETDSGCACTACGQTWGSISTFIRDRLYHQIRGPEPSQRVTPANAEHLSEQWAETINELPLKFSIALLRFVTKIIIRLVKSIVTMLINMAVLVFVTFPILIFTPLYLKWRDRNIRLI